MNGAAPGESITVDGCRIGYRHAGAGPLVVLLHCSASHSGQWKPLMALLAAEFTLLAPDLHGYGRSEPLPRDGQPFFPRDTAAAAALIESRGGRAHLVGHSLGGTVALRLALTRPELVASLTLIEPVQFSILEELRDPARIEYYEITLEVASHVHFGRVDEAARAFVDFWVAPGAFAAMEPQAAAYVVQTIGRVADDWAGISRHAPGQIALADCRRLSMPCHLIRGTATRASAAAITGHLAATIPAALLTDLPGAGHMAAASAPQSVNPAIAAFLRRHGAG